MGCDKDKLTPRQLVNGIFVDSKRGYNCEGNGTKCHPFRTLNYALKRSQNISAPVTRIYLYPGEYIISVDISYRNIEFYGYISQSKRNVGIIFDTVSGVYNTDSDLGFEEVVDTNTPFYSDGKWVPWGSGAESPIAGIVNNSFYTAEELNSTQYPVRTLRTSIRLQHRIKNSDLTFNNIIVYNEISKVDDIPARSILANGAIIQLSSTSDQINAMFAEINTWITKYPAITDAISVHSSDVSCPSPDPVTNLYPDPVNENDIVATFISTTFQSALLTEMQSSATSHGLMFTQDISGLLASTLTSDYVNDQLNGINFNYSSCCSENLNFCASTLITGIGGIVRQTTFSSYLTPTSSSAPGLIKQSFQNLHLCGSKLTSGIPSQITLQYNLKTEHSGIIGNLIFSESRIHIKKTISQNLTIHRPLGCPYIDHLTTDSRLFIDGSYGSISNIFTVGLDVSRTALAGYENLNISPVEFDGLAPLNIIQTTISSDSNLNMRINPLGSEAIHSLNSKMSFREGATLNLNVFEDVYPFNLEESYFTGSLNIGVINSEQSTPRIFNVTRGSKVSLSESSYSILPDGPEAVSFSDVSGEYNIPNTGLTLFSVQPTLGLNPGTLSSLTNFPNPT